MFLFAKISAARQVDVMCVGAKLIDNVERHRFLSPYSLGATRKAEAEGAKEEAQDNSPLKVVAIQVQIDKPDQNARKCTADECNRVGTAVTVQGRRHQNISKLISETGSVTEV